MTDSRFLINEQQIGVRTLTPYQGEKKSLWRFPL